MRSVSRRLTKCELGLVSAPLHGHSGVLAAEGVCTSAVTSVYDQGGEDLHRLLEV